MTPDKAWIVPKGPSGLLLIQTIGILTTGIADGSYKQPVRATVQIGGLEYLTVLVDQDDLKEARLRGVAADLFPLTLDIQHAGGSSQITIAPPGEGQV